MPGIHTAQPHAPHGGSQRAIRAVVKGERGQEGDGCCWEGTGGTCRSRTEGRPRGGSDVAPRNGKMGGS